MLRSIRQFFAERGVLEVETPLLCQTTGTDPNLSPFASRFQLPGQAEGSLRFLQTSPEFAMKRLLASGSGAIYQICKAFRNEESGRYHNPEFTLLEWYRPGFSLENLIDEIEALIFKLTSLKKPSERISYTQAFLNHAKVNPIKAPIRELAECAHQHRLDDAGSLCGKDRANWLDFLFNHIVQPHLGQDRLSFVFDYPACMPSLARKKDPHCVERVEVFLNGTELANGYRELLDPIEQERRFDADLAVRRNKGLLLPPKDRKLLSALTHGLPDCSGVALGLDRLLMQIANVQTIDEVLTFPMHRA